ncbi:hypothetical protein GCM10007863_11150 [Dyella mobilis]|nr:hypothetical protein GCM10007863_11150 [Dyella mobilis]
MLNAQVGKQAEQNEHGGDQFELTADPGYWLNQGGMKAINSHARNGREAAISRFLRACAGTVPGKQAYQNRVQ